VRVLDSGSSAEPRRDGGTDPERRDRELTNTDPSVEALYMLCVLTF